MNITQRLVLLFLIVSLSFCGFIYVYFQIKKQEGNIYSQADALQRKQIINAFIEIKKNNVMRVIDTKSNNHVFDDILSNPSSKPIQRRLQSLIALNNQDLIQVYDSTGTLLFSGVSDKDAQLKDFRFDIVSTLFLSLNYAGISCSKLNHYHFSFRN